MRGSPDGETPGKSRRGGLIHESYAANLTPPARSSIEVGTESVDPVITIPAGRGGAMRILSALFIAFWLCGWTAGFATVGSQVLSGKASAFSVFWLGGWTIGGCFAAMYLYRLVRPSIPETLRL